MRIKKGRALKSFLKKPWLLSAALILIAATAIYSSSFIDSDKEAEEALLSGQRVEVVLATGEVFGGLGSASSSLAKDQNATNSDEPEENNAAEAPEENFPEEVVEAEVVEARKEPAYEEQLRQERQTKEIEGNEENILNNDAEVVAQQSAVKQNDVAQTTSVEEASAELSEEEKAFSQQMLEERRKKINLSDGKKPIVVVISDVGLSVRTTEKTLEMPVNFTIGFSPYAPDVALWNKKAIVLGYDTLLHLPMETPDYSVDDPGPYALVSTASGEENLSRLEMLLSLGVGYKGVYSSPNENFSININNMRPIVTGLADLNMPFLYGRGAGNVSLLQFSEHSRIALVTNDVTIDNKITYEDISQQLAKLEKMAIENEYAIGMARPYPLTLNTLAYWQKGLEEKGLEIVPFSLLIDQLKDAQP